MVTGSRGQLLTDLFESTGSEADRELDTAIASIEEGRTDLGGSLLGTFNLRYVVLDPGPGVHRWLSQRDLSLVRSEPTYIVLENQSRLQRAAIYPEIPPQLEALENRDPTGLRAAFPEVTPAEQTATAAYEHDNASGPGVALVAQASDEGWVAEVDGIDLDRTDGGWANAFLLDSSTEVLVEIRYPRSTADLVWLLLLGLAWIVVAGGAFSRRRAPTRGQRPVR